MVRVLSREEQQLFLNPQGQALAWSRAMSSAAFLPNDELRVFVFISLRTLRFSNRVEKISFDEFLNGARRRQGLLAPSVRLTLGELQSAIERLLMRTAIIREEIAGACFYGINLEWVAGELAAMPQIQDAHYDFDQTD